MVGKQRKMKRYASGNPDLRHRSQMPGPEIAEIEQRLYQLLSPALLAPRQMERHNPKDPKRPIRMRARLLTLPVMMAIILSLVCRRLPSLAEAQRLLERDGLLWVSPLRVSQQAINRRLDTMPAEVVGELLQELCQQLKAEPPGESDDRWGHLTQDFPSLLVVDGSTLEELRQKSGELRGVDQPVLGGKIMVMVELLGLKPVWVRYTEESSANDKVFAQEILEGVPQGGLLVYDLGFFSFVWFDAFTEQGRYFVTRMREKTAYRVVETLSQGPYYRDQIIQLGQYRSNPCQHPVRLVEVLWGSTWYRYLTNVVNPQMLSPRDVCELYRRRWRVEDAFLLTKRVLDLAYLWSGSRNAVQLQVYATLIFYGVLIEVCQETAMLLGQPLERISVEMVFRGFYHYSQALQKGSSLSLVSFLTEHARLLGLVKRVRKRDREHLQGSALVWADP